LSDGGSETQYLCGIDPTLYKTASNCAADDDEDSVDDEGLDGQVDGSRGLGSVRFGVMYERETERLTVTLVRARSLPSRNPGTANACDPFVRFDGDIQKTSCIACRQPAADPQRSPVSSQLLTIPWHLNLAQHYPNPITYCAKVDAILTTAIRLVFSDSPHASHS